MNPYLEKCLPYLRKSFTNLPHLHFRPYTWPPDSIYPVEVLNKWARAHLYLNFIPFVASTVFVIWHTALVWLHSTQPQSVRFYMALVSLSYLLTANFFLTVMLRTVMLE